MSAGKLKEKIKKNFFFASLKSLKKGVGYGSIGPRYLSAPKCHGSPTLLLSWVPFLPDGNPRPPWWLWGARRCSVLTAERSSASSNRLPTRPRFRSDPSLLFCVLAVGRSRSFNQGCGSTFVPMQVHMDLVSTKNYKSCTAKQKINFIG